MVRGLAGKILRVFYVFLMLYLSFYGGIDHALFPCAFFTLSFPRQYFVPRLSSPFILYSTHKRSFFSIFLHKRTFLGTRAVPHYLSINSYFHPSPSTQYGHFFAYQIKSNPRPSTPASEASKKDNFPFSSFFHAYLRKQQH